jgi:hypothetical protein
MSQVDTCNLCFSVPKPGLEDPRISIMERTASQVLDKNETGQNFGKLSYNC